MQGLYASIAPVIHVCVLENTISTSLHHQVLMATAYYTGADPGGVHQVPLNPLPLEVTNFNILS